MIAPHSQRHSHIGVVRAPREFLLSERPITVSLPKTCPVKSGDLSHPQLVVRIKQTPVFYIVVISVLYTNAVTEDSNIFVIIKSKTVTRGNINPKDIWSYLPKSNGSKNKDYGNRFVNIICTKRI